MDPHTANEIGKFVMGCIAGGLAAVGVKGMEDQVHQFFPDRFVPEIDPETGFDTPNYALRKLALRATGSILIALPFLYYGNISGAVGAGAGHLVTHYLAETSQVPY